MNDEELAKIIEYAHSINKKVYVALNIYARDNMYEEIKKQVKFFLINKEFCKYITVFYYICKRNTKLKLR